MVSNFSRTLFGALLLLSFSVTTTTAQPLHPLAEPGKNDNFLDFLKDLTSVTNLALLQENGHARGAAVVIPWSSSFWPYYRGLLGARYADPDYVKSRNFIDNYTNFYATPADQYLTPERIRYLSPAEKYDLLIGDRTWTLTNNNWGRGKQVYDEHGSVPSWTGICHGWVAAAHQDIKPPVLPVTVTDVTGTYAIPFYPQDIRGLVSYLWAESSPPSFQAGARCRQSEIVKDEYLRPVEISCLDANPMTWHLTITNRLGTHGKSFVMDASAGAEVWNYPITAYDYTYFNVKTMEPSDRFEDALRPLAEITNDRFRAHRSPRAKFLVGVSMDVFHPALIEPNTGSSREPVMQAKNFIYDLELDEGLNVVGGEWYSKETPDFLWTFPPGGDALTSEDIALGGAAWDTAVPLPAAIASPAILATRKGHVLATIVKALHARSVEASAPENPEHGGHEDRPIEP